jgi:hypothetical protein
MTIKDILGKFSIIGSNQDESEETYKGILNLSLDDKNRIIAKWQISKSQEQFGVGFFKENILAINFNYQGDENKTYYGTIVYKCLTKDIFEGFWSEEFGNSNYLGSENCFRITDKKEL